MDANDRQAQLFEELRTMFLPHVMAVQWPKILAWARSPYSMDEKKAILVAPFFIPVRLGLRAFGQEGPHLEPIMALAGQMAKAILHLPRCSRRMIAANKEQWMTEATAVFVRSWLSMLSWHGYQELDDDMLPKRSGMGAAKSIVAHGGDQLTVEDVRAALRAVRRSLPADQQLPPQAIALIEFKRRLFS